MDRQAYDVIVVGGGAAGMSAALSAARRGYKVCILDKNKKMGKKLYATGNGHCNLANAKIGTNYYHTSYEKGSAWLEQALTKEPNTGLFSFLHSIGIKEIEDNGYFYPQSMQASSVVWAFLDALKKEQVDLYTAVEVNDIKQTADGFEIYSNQSTYYASNVILACGGRSYHNLGGGSIGYKLATSLSLKTQAIRPALCGCLTREDTEMIQGVRVACCASIVDDASKKTRIQRGELQITDYGLSGIMIFNLSHEIGRLLETKDSVCVSLNLLEYMEKSLFLDVYHQSKHRTILAFLNSFLPDKLAAYVLNSIGFEAKKSTGEYTESEIHFLFSRCQNFTFHIHGLQDFERAQVTAGGVELSQIEPESMKCKEIEGLYVVGELLDIDGDCGGYNLTFAILSGIHAGEHITC